jgi:hypothetical protein
MAKTKLLSVIKPDMTGWTFIGIGIGDCREDRTFCVMIWVGKYALCLGPHV